MRLYLITHAATQQSRTQAVTTWSLSAAGAQQATKLATLPFWADVQGIILSSEAKTRLTVEPTLAHRSLPVELDARFDELRRGGWVKDYTTRVAQAFAQPTAPSGDWEAAADALARFRSGIADLCVRYSGQTLALVGHGLTFSLYRAHLLGQTQVALADWQQLSFAAVALVDPVRAELLQDFQAIAGSIPRGGA